MAASIPHPSDDNIAQDALTERITTADSLRNSELYLRDKEAGAGLSG
jgi:hypothetical protein